jgi:hypothetical protein
MIGLGEGKTVERLSWPVYRAVLQVLRPAEAAVRRLVIVVARGMVVKPSPVRAAPAGLKISSKSRGRVSFRLFDPRKRFEGVTGRRRKGPRIRVIGRDFDPRIPPFFRPGYVPPPPKPAPPPDGTVNAGPLCRRLAAIKMGPSTTCRARPGAMPAGGRGRSRRAVRNFSRPSAPAHRRDFASGPPMRSRRSSPNANGWPTRSLSPTHPERLPAAN